MSIKNSRVDKLATELKKYIKEDTIIVCIGSDKCIGDSLAPIVGHILDKKRSFPIRVYGTLNYPIHAMNIESFLHTIKSNHPNAFVIAIDAGLGHIENIGKILIRNRAIRPGYGVFKELPEIGNVSILGIVEEEENGLLLYQNKANIRLSLIVNMAETIAQALIKASKMYQNDKKI